MKIEFIARNTLEVPDESVAEFYGTANPDEIVEIDREAFKADPLMFLEDGTFEVKVIE